MKQVRPSEHIPRGHGGDEKLKGKVRGKGNIKMDLK
jgi:hypothetical protein